MPSRIRLDQVENMSIARRCDPFKMGARKRHTPFPLSQQPVRLRGNFFDDDEDGHEDSTPAMVSPFIFFPCALNLNSSSVKLISPA